jgi:4,5-DOPA dioxygenase extradiol
MRFNDRNPARLSRRALLSGGLALAVAGKDGVARAETAVPAPVGFVSHGSPLLAIDAVRGGELRRWGHALARPKGIVVMTPHYGTRRLELGSTARGFALYDFPGWLKRRLPQNLDYRSPPSEGLARRVTELLAGQAQPHRSARRGFDHTTWMPLMHLFPKADVPVLEIAYPYLGEAKLFALGRRLGALRDEGVLFLASGGMTHNLASIDLDREQAAPVWSSEFDAWAAERLAALDADALVDWRNKAPAARLAHPDDGGHFRVLVVALGVALGSRTAVTRARFPVTGYESTLSKRAVELS